MGVDKMLNFVRALGRSEGIGCGGQDGLVDDWREQTDPDCTLGFWAETTEEEEDDDDDGFTWRIRPSPMSENALSPPPQLFVRSLSNKM